MVRKKIIWYPGALYHITSRGNHRNDIFRDEEDYQVYLTILEEALNKPLENLDMSVEQARQQSFLAMWSGRLSENYFLYTQPTIYSRLS